MPKSRNRKDHKKKLNQRNGKIELAKKEAKKMQQRFLEELIKREQTAGMFNDNTIVGSNTIDEIQGPEI